MKKLIYNKPINKSLIDTLSTVLVFTDHTRYWGSRQAEPREPSTGVRSFLLSSFPLTRKHPSTYGRNFSAESSRRWSCALTLLVHSRTRWRSTTCESEWPSWNVHPWQTYEGTIFDLRGVVMDLSQERLHKLSWDEKAEKEAKEFLKSCDHLPGPSDETVCWLRRCLRSGIHRPISGGVPCQVAPCTWWGYSGDHCVWFKIRLTPCSQAVDSVENPLDWTVVEGVDGIRREKRRRILKMAVSRRWSIRRRVRRTSLLRDASGPQNRKR